MTDIQQSEHQVRIRLDSDEDVWFWERRFNVFDFLELFPMDAVTPPSEPDEKPPHAPVQLTINTDADFSFETDIVRGGFYWRNQSHGTRKWMAKRHVTAGDSIVIERTGDTVYFLRKESSTDDNR
ncbi:MAG: hypothetical protein GF341_02865 [candidate division Zixibacteria bacterium]|nr:hypothetical protein [candidate division Zixibacteria bacterium]